MLRLVLLRLCESYFRHRWLYLVPIVLMGALAAVFIALSPKVYIARGILYVQNDSLLSRLAPIGNDGFSWVTPSQLTANEINELLRTEAFVRFAIGKTDLEKHMSEGPEAVQQTIRLFRESIWLGTAGDKLVGFSGKHEDPELAHQIANAGVEAYIEWKLNSDRQESVVAQAFFAKQLPPLQEELAKVNTELQAFLQAHPVPVRGERPEAEQMELSRLQAAVEQAKQRVQETLQKEEEARLALEKAESITNQAYTVIDAPTVPTRPETSLKDAVKDSAIFVVLGVILSAAGVVGGMLLDRSFRMPLDVRHGLNLPVLAVIPEARGRVVAAPAERRKPADQPQEARTPAAQPTAGRVEEQPA